MKNLNDEEPRCAGEDAKTGETCHQRFRCARHGQLQRDRELGLHSRHNQPGLRMIRVFRLPRVRGNDCSYLKAEAP
ncbi:MAG: hypothetical protein ABI574_04625 [Burkholderiales bacterium]